MEKDYIQNIDNQAERRFVQRIEARADDAGNRTIEGEAATIDQPTTIQGEYEEVIRAGAFNNVIADDIRVLKNHDPNLILGRSKAGQGTAKVFVNSTGALAFSVPVRENRTSSLDTHDEILSGDIDGCSFAFRVGKEKWTWPDETNGRSMPLREILEFKTIFDVGPVTYPAYQSTSVVARSLDEVRPTPINLIDQRKELFKRKYSKQNG